MSRDASHWSARWRRRAGRFGATLAGHVLLAEALFALPIFLLMCAVNFSLGILTPASLRHAALVWLLLGALGGALSWQIVSPPPDGRERPSGRTMPRDPELGQGDS